MARQSFTPIDDRVLIEPAEPLTQSPGGIILPDNAKERPSWGTVRAVGPGKRIEFTGERAAMTIQVGDQVLFAKYSGSEVELGDSTLLVVREADCLGVVGTEE